MLKGPSTMRLMAYLRSDLLSFNNWESQSEQMSYNDNANTERIPLENSLIHVPPVRRCMHSGMNHMHLRHQSTPWHPRLCTTSLRARLSTSDGEKTIFQICDMTYDLWHDLYDLWHWWKVLLRLAHCGILCSAGVVERGAFEDQVYWWWPITNHAADNLNDYCIHTHRLNRPILTTYSWQDNTHPFKQPCCVNRCPEIHTWALMSPEVSFLFCYSSDCPMKLKLALRFDSLKISSLNKINNAVEIATDGIALSATYLVLTPRVHTGVTQ